MKAWVGKGGRMIVVLGVILVALVSLLGALPLHSPWAFFADQPRLHYLGFLLVWTMLAIVWLRSRWLGGLGVVGILVNAWVVIPVWWNGGNELDDEPSLRVVHANLDIQESLPKSLVEFVEEQEAEVLCLQEVTPEMAKALSQWKEYRVLMLMPREDSHGLALLVRKSLGGEIRLRRARLLYFGEEVSHRPYGEVILEIEGKVLRILSFSTRRPGGGGALATQERELEGLGNWFEEGGESASLALGDFNVTPWSRFMRVFLKNADLPRKQTGFALAPTWPGGWLAPVGVPIDLCVHGEGVQVSTIVGPKIGSDHAPICCEVLLR